ncbi:ADP-ribosyltransferase, partial [Streptomyces sp. NPDC001634]|uniref:ADP-ribosyltransferase n=1 Tax=Streptomyces sp. NPDC001634 TaxID=3154390 RepID=UPI00332B6641
AAGAVTFNVLTTVFTGGEGAAAAGAGKAGAIAKALSVAGKAGRIIDPMTYVSKGVGAGLSKIGDVTKALKGVGHVDIPTLPDGSVHLPNDHLLDPHGNILGPDGTVPTVPTPHEVAPGLPAHWTIPNQPPVSPGIPHAAADGVHGGVPHTTDGVYGGMPHTGNGVYGGMPHTGNGVYGGIPHGHTPTTGLPHDMPAAAHDVPTVPHDVPTAPHDVPAGTPHTGGHDVPGGHTPETAPHGTGHDATPGSHTDGASHGAGHDHHGAGHDGAGHTDDAAHAGDDTGLGHDAVDTAAHPGTDAPVAPGHPGTDVPVHGGAGEAFEYKPSMSTAEFEGLSDAEKHAVATAELAHGTNPAPSISNKAGMDYGNANWNEFMDGLSPEEKRGLVTYTGSAYTPINNHLRYGTHASESTLRTIKEMDQVMGARPVPEDIMVVRGTGIDHLNLKSPLDMRGGVYDDPAYTSTALGKTPPPPFDAKPVRMHLRVPKGTPALWLESLTQVKGERELLLARGTEYKVTRVFMDESDGKWHVYGEVLPRP